MDEGVGGAVDERSETEGWRSGQVSLPPASVQRPLLCTCPRHLSTVLSTATCALCWCLLSLSHPTTLYRLLLFSSPYARPPLATGTAQLPSPVPCPSHHSSRHPRVVLSFLVSPFLLHPVASAVTRSSLLAALACLSLTSLMVRPTSCSPRVCICICFLPILVESHHLCSLLPLPLCLPLPHRFPSSPLCLRPPPTGSSHEEGAPHCTSSSAPPPPTTALPTR